jgi:hypothetical protein
LGTKESFYAVLMLVIIVGAHAVAFWSFGATFWIDSIAYVSLGDALFDPNKLRTFYDGIGRWSYSHLGPGTPLFWSGLQLLPIRLQWPTMAVLQHLMAALSSWSAFAWAIRPSLLALCGVGMLSFLPFYQSGHQMLMTESFASSLLLIAVALAIRLATQLWSETIFAALLCSLLLVAQFRSYFAAMVTALVLVVLLRTGRCLSKRLIILLAVLAVSILAFPTYRFFTIQQFFMPSMGSNALLSALWADPTPSNNLVPVFEHSQLPKEFTAREILLKGLDYNGVALIAQHWRQEGLTDEQIVRRAGALAKLVNQDGVRPTINRFLYGLTSCGFILPYKLGPSSYEVFRGMSMEAEWSHQVAYYRWFSWIDPTDYKNSFDYFFRTPQIHIPSSVESQRQIVLTFEPYLKSKIEYFRNPFFLGAISIDAWGLFGLIGLLALCFRGKWALAIILVIPFVVNFLAIASAGFPNVRYAYALLPIYFLAGVIGLESLKNPRYLAPEDRP